MQETIYRFRVYCEYHNTGRESLDGTRSLFYSSESKEQAERVAEDWQRRTNKSGLDDRFIVIDHGSNVDVERAVY